MFRRREEAAQQQLSPKEQREAYKVIQKGGDVPLHGLRKLAPEKPKGKLAENGWDNSSFLSKSTKIMRWR